MPHHGLLAHTQRAPAATPPLPTTPDHIAASERVAEADSLTCACALHRCSSDLFRPAHQRHDHDRQRARIGARCTSRQLGASHEHELARARLLCPVLRLRRILMCHTPVPRVTHLPLLLPRSLHARPSAATPPPLPAMNDSTPASDSVAAAY